jgi:ATP-dependent RNA helicase DeaD
MKFAELNLHPALAATLAARGYETATPVQASVLASESAGRDLLVSSETGSGKTIAFGVALAETLLGPPAADGSGSKATHGPNPVALVIVPTRELAAQVREELSWLLQKTGLRSAAFTGGTPVGGDLRILQRGVDLVIGTPGRLVDLLRRQRLTLSDLRVVVLDEADEMLDLGFREDLETILKTAPATRRTLLLSATLPTEIRAMARKFQRDALAVDPRKVDGAGGATRPAAAHSDITYVAHLIAGGDRLAAVVNVLRAAGNARAIVFCTTREGVATTHAALVARGFSAVAISGDRVQAERDRALDQLRRGEVQVLVATNVAARGLHLPDVDLIVHADLPLNAESLTHRSGRTGRAGRKGTAVVIARVVERYKAERLLASAHVKPVWTPAPSAKTIAAAALTQLLEELVSDTEPDDSGADELLKQLDGKLDLPALARKLLTRELGRLPAGEPLAKVPMPAPGSGPRDDRGPSRGRFSESSGPPPSRAELSRGGVVFRVNIGANDNADPRWLLPLICRRGGVTRREVGAIRIAPRETLFEIAGNAAGEFAAAAAEIDPRARHVVIERADAPQRAPEPARERSREHVPARAPEPEIAEKTPFARPSRSDGERPRPAPAHETYARPAHAKGPGTDRNAARPSGGHETYARPTHLRPAHPSAAHARPAHPSAAHAKPAHPAAAHARSTHPPSAHPRPAYPRPAYAAAPAHAGPRKHSPKGPGKPPGKHAGK